MRENSPSKDYIDFICALYGDVYDDRLEDSKPPTAGYESRVPGSDWSPGKFSMHKSLQVFQKELEEKGIKMSTSKIRKILITGGCWSTERSREVERLFKLYTLSVSNGGLGFKEDIAIKRIANELKVSVATVTINLPYISVVYNLEHKSKNAVRCEEYKKRKQIKK
ncbi:hypothetical protein SAMN05660484_00845 [Eubacterium ruminantium]|uniref:Regulatory protein, luxR family n=1 Tax=Eubacterium ruminantium TaxID=42322 RepID=A0A1T4LSK0_9FIRM|nr:hypothetical protein [Eubacterium ruminantium]SCW40028.1 hypothetical protein SAMN05660484_00845 [Eubacterium ruminantium]SDM40608.1 hypothetical protein SAMN04490370_10355 [Eubacterium ruminantium]SJZ57611.1 hypothetical protein SAMN02745110_00907 [Eubacterium ruminantium]